MNDRIDKQIRDLEIKRDFNLKIRCPHVAARFQRMIDQLKKEYGKT